MTIEIYKNLKLLYPKHTHTIYYIKRLIYLIKIGTYLDTIINLVL